VHDQLWDKYKIEAPIFTFNGSQYIRISCHVYNEEADYLLLAKAVREIQGLEQLPSSLL